jgi:hypothetical protein
MYSTEYGLKQWSYDDHCELPHSAISTLDHLLRLLLAVLHFLHFLTNNCSIAAVFANNCNVAAVFALTEPGRKGLRSSESICPFPLRFALAGDVRGHPFEHSKEDGVFEFCLERLLEVHWQEAVQPRALLG